VRNDKGKIVIAKNDNALIHLFKVRTICTSQEKEIIPMLKVLVLSCLFVCLFVCLFYKVVNGWKELSSKVQKFYNNHDCSLH